MWQKGNNMPTYTVTISLHERRATRGAVKIEAKNAFEAALAANSLIYLLPDEQKAAGLVFQKPERDGFLGDTMSFVVADEAGLAIPVEDQAITLAREMRRQDKPPAS